MTNIGPEGYTLNDQIPQVTPRYDGLEILQRGRELDPSINLLGTTIGDWQIDVKDYLTSLGVPPSAVFDPRLPPGVEYEEQNTLNEIEAMAKAAFHYMNIGRESTGKISSLEWGVVLLHVLAGAKALVRFEPLPHADEGEARVAGRIRGLMYTALGSATRHLIDTDALEVHVANPYIPVSGQQTRQDRWFESAAETISRARGRGTGIIAEHAYRPRDNHTLKRQVIVSGSAVAPENSQAKTQVMEALGDVPKFDTYIPPPYNNLAMRRERQMHDESAVGLHVITNDTEGQGAVAGMFWQAALAALNGQKFGVYIEPDGPGLSPGAVGLRRSLRYHWQNYGKCIKGLFSRLRLLWSWGNGVGAS